MMATLELEIRASRFRQVEPLQAHHPDNIEYTAEALQTCRAARKLKESSYGSSPSCYGAAGETTLFQYVDVLGTVGDNTTDKPGMFDLKGKAKWSAWDGKKGTSSDDAKKAYVALVQKLIEKYGL